MWLDTWMTGQLDGVRTQKIQTSVAILPSIWIKMTVRLGHAWQDIDNWMQETSSSTHRKDSNLVAILPRILQQDNLTATGCCSWPLFIAMPKIWNSIHMVRGWGSHALSVAACFSPVRMTPGFPARETQVCMHACTHKIQKFPEPRPEPKHTSYFIAKILKRKKNNLKENHPLTFCCMRAQS